MDCLANTFAKLRVDFCDINSLIGDKKNVRFSIYLNILNTHRSNTSVRMQWQVTQIKKIHDCD